MRLAPVPIHYSHLFPGDLETLARLATESSLPTHASPPCLSACAYLALVLSGLIRGVAREDVLADDWEPLKRLRRELVLAPRIDEASRGSLSARKASYVADLTTKVNDGTINLREIGRLSDERVVDTLTEVKGIGRWTARMFLIFSLGRPDVFPHGDLGVRTAIRDRYGLDELPDKETSHAIAESWRPFASVASWYCWRTLDLARNMETVAKA